MHGQARSILIGIVAVVCIGVVAAAVSYRRQITSYLTHWKGSPRGTVAYQYFPAEPAPLLRIAAAGDVGDSGKRITATGAAVAAIAAQSPYDVMMVLGDNVYPSGDPGGLAKTVFGPFGAVLDHGATLLAIVGNHDVKNGNGPRQMAALGMPGLWWARQFGDVLIVGLDSNQPDNAEQRTFLETTLSTTTAKWRIVALHHPPYSAGYQGSSKNVRAAFSPLFERYGVQLVLSGHDHDYQRSEPINGVTYVVSGAGAGTRRTGSASFTAVSFSWHHFVDITVFADHLVGRAVNQDQRVADEFVIDGQGGGPS
ncbi:MAG: metallophosphoesterase [Acidimicrobiia bacterium]